MAKQERAVRTRNALIESAAELFHQDGYEVASLSVISARAGVSSGALHFHFASKAELADAVADAAHRRLGRITAASEGGHRRGALQVLIDATHTLARALRDDAVLRAGFGLDRARRPDTGRPTVLGTWQHWVLEVLQRARVEGSLAPGVSVEGAMRTVVAATVGFEVLGGRDVRWLSQTAVDQFWSLLLPSLTAGANRRSLVVSGSASPGVPRPGGPEE